MTLVVIKAAPFLITQNMVSLGHQFEHFLCNRISRVAVRVILESKFSKSFLDILGRGTLLQAKNSIVVSTACHSNTASESNAVHLESEKKILFDPEKINDTVFYN
jgi:hypothetical protein